MSKKKLVQKYMDMAVKDWPVPLFFFVQGYCAAVGACGDVLYTAVETWFNRKKKNRLGTE